jgi:hypothetical protein
LIRDFKIGIENNTKLSCTVDRKENSISRHEECVKLLSSDSCFVRPEIKNADFEWSRQKSFGDTQFVTAKIAA